MQTPTPETLQIDNTQLAQATPGGILRWAYQRYGAGLCFATMLDAEGCALIALLAEAAPRVPVLLPDTGYLAPQVLALREELQGRYGLEIRLVRPDAQTAAFESEHGPLYQTQPARCCRINRWEPLRAIFTQYTARIAARRPAHCPSQPLQPVAWDVTLQLAQIHPLARWTNEDLLCYLDAHAVPQLPADAPIGCAACPQRWSDVVPAESVPVRRGIHGFWRMLFTP